ISSGVCENYNISAYVGHCTISVAPFPLNRWLRRCGELAVKRQPLPPGRDDDLVAVLHRPGEDLLGERVLHRFLDHALERARAVGGVQPFSASQSRALGSRAMVILRSSRSLPSRRIW